MNLINKIEKILKEKITNYTKINTYSNQMYKLEIPNNIFYCKIYTDSQDHHLCKKTHLFYLFLKNKQIHCPEVIYAYYPWDNQEMGPNPFIILGKLPGENLKSLLHLNRDSLYNYPMKLNQIYYSLGEYTGRIHSCRFSEFGDLAVKKENQSEFVVGPIQSLNPIIKKGPFKTWPLYFKEILKSRISEINHPIINEIKPKLEKFIENELAQEYCKNITPRLCHGDLNKKNVFITGEKISGTIDPDDSFIGNSEEDLMRLELDHFEKYPNLRKIFYDGYSKYNQLDNDFEMRRPILYISRQLVGAQCVLKFTNLYSTNIKEDLKIIKNNIIQAFF